MAGTFHVLAGPFRIVDNAAVRIPRGVSHESIYDVLDMATGSFFDGESEDAPEPAGVRKERSVVILNRFDEVLVQLAAHELYVFGMDGLVVVQANVVRVGVGQNFFQHSPVNRSVQDRRVVLAKKYERTLHDFKRPLGHESLMLEVRERHECYAYFVKHAMRRQIVKICDVGIDVVFLLFADTVLHDVNGRGRKMFSHAGDGLFDDVRRRMTWNRR